MLPQLWQCAKKPLQMVLGDVCLHHLKLYGIVSREDTAQSALEAQKFFDPPLYFAGNGAKYRQGEKDGHPH